MMPAERIGRKQGDDRLPDPIVRRLHRLAAVAHHEVHEATRAEIAEAPRRYRRLALAACRKIEVATGRPWVATSSRRSRASRVEAGDALLDHLLERGRRRRGRTRPRSTGGPGPARFGRGPRRRTRCLPIPGRWRRPRAARLRRWRPSDRARDAARPRARAGSTMMLRTSVPSKPCSRSFFRNGLASASAPCRSPRMSRSRGACGGRITSEQQGRAVDVAPLHVVEVQDRRTESRQLREQRPQRGERLLPHALRVVDRSDEAAPRSTRPAGGPGKRQASAQVSGGRGSASPRCSKATRQRLSASTTPSTALYATDSRSYAQPRRITASLRDIRPSRKC